MMTIFTNGKSMVRVSPRGAQGIVLIDALVAILIFSIGILGMVALQANAVSLSSDAQYRTEAAMLAGQVIGEMWSSDPTALATNFAGSGGSGGASYAAWNTRVGNLPAGVGGIVVGSAGIVTITVEWQQPSDPELHTYTSVTQIAY